jgi:HK97 family phage major capsid protein
MLDPGGNQATIDDRESDEPMGLPKALPKQYVSFELIECTRRMRAAGDGAPGDAGATADAADQGLTFDLVISTERPTEKWYGIETLSHEKNAIDMSYAKNGLSLLLEHGACDADMLASNLVDPELHVGIVDEVTIGGDRKLHGVARFSRVGSAVVAASQVEDRTRRFVSVGYVPRKFKVTKQAQAPGEKDEILVTKWTPVEVSLVSVPADPNAQVRSIGGQEFPIEVETDQPAGEEPPMLQNIKLSPDGGSGGGAAAAPAPAGKGAEITLTEAEVQHRSLSAVQARNKEVAEIATLCRRNRIEEKVETDYIQSGKSLQEVGLDILQRRKSEPLPTPAAEFVDGLPAKDRKRYSVGRALDMLVRRTLGQAAFDGIEGEVHAHLERRAKEAGIQSHGSGVFLPMSLGADLERRTMATNIATKGSEFVFDQPGELIEFLRNQAVVFRMGARMLTDLTGPVTFPKQQGDVTVSWVGENPASAVAASDVATGAVMLTQKTMQGTCKISRQLLAQSNIDHEGMIRESFAQAHGLAFDRAALHGLGSSSQPTGIYSAPDVLTTTMANVLPTWQKITDMIGQVGSANALAGTLGFVTTMGFGARFLSVLQQSAAGLPFIWTGPLQDGKIGGYRAIASTQALANLGAGANEHCFIFGNWADMIAGLFGGIEVIADPFTSATSGLVNFTSFQMGDIVLRRGQSFSKATLAQLA